MRGRATHTEAVVQVHRVHDALDDLALLELVQPEPVLPIKHQGLHGEAGLDLRLGQHVVAGNALTPPLRCGAGGWLRNTGGRTRRE